MERERKYERDAPFFTRALTLVPRSLLRDRTETLATQTKNGTAYLKSSRKKALWIELRNLRLAHSTDLISVFF